MTGTPFRSGLPQLPALLAVLLAAVVLQDAGQPRNALILLAQRLLHGLLVLNELLLVLFLEG